MFERFTERARQVVVLAQEEARGLRHNYIGTEHLLLGLLREEEGLAANALERLDVGVERARAQVIRIVGPGQEVTSGQIPFTPRAKRVLELALRESKSLGHDYIGTEHILLGLANENEGVAARILLVDFDAGPEAIRREVMALLSGPAGRRRLGAVPTIGGRPRPLLDWERARMQWRVEGLELRVPLALAEGELAALAADPAWSAPPLAGLWRELWSGWLALASPSLLEDVEPLALRRALDAAAARAKAATGAERARVEDFLRRLQDGA